MSQYFAKACKGSTVFAVLVDEEQTSKYTVANYNTAPSFFSAAQVEERRQAMKRLYEKMRAQYPKGDVELVQIVPIDADTVRVPIDSMDEDALRAEVRRLRTKVGEEV